MTDTTTGPLYPLLGSTDAIYDHWTPIVSGRVQPDEWRARLIGAVQRALDAEMFYTKDLDAFVAQDLADVLTPELLARNNPVGVGVAGGLFGYEVYFARQAIEAKAARESRDAAHARLDPQVGQNYGTLYLNGKRTTGCTVSRIHGTTLTFTGKRGSSGCSFTLTAEQLEELQADARARKAQAGPKRARAA